MLILGTQPLTGKQVIETKRQCRLASRDRLYTARSRTARLFCINKGLFWL